MDNKKIFISVIILLILGTIATVLLRSGEENIPSVKYDEFAKCIASKNLTMYGTYSCSYCAKQKKMFENSFKYVPYVECTQNPQECMAKDIEAYPTWIDGSGQKYVGLQSLEKLSEISGCSLPIEGGVTSELPTD